MYIPKGFTRSELLDMLDAIKDNEQTIDGMESTDGFFTRLLTELVTLDDFQDKSDHWNYVWYGSPGHEGSNVFTSTKHGSNAEHVANFGRDYHEQISDLVRRHNVIVDRMKGHAIEPTDAVILEIAQIIDPSAWQAIADGRDAIPGSLWEIRRTSALDKARRIMTELVK